MDSVLELVDKVKAAGPLGGTSMVTGAIVLLGILKKFVESFYKTFLRPAQNLKKLGKWAVVTGATDGIGKAYAFELAKRGMSVVIISRTESKLQDVKAEIDAKKYDGVEIKYIVCDYSKFDEKARNMVEQELSGLEVGVLINNVGVSYRYPRYFHELPRDEIQNLMTMNIDSTVWMTEMVLKDMVARKRGAIVNLSSAAARYTQPFLSEYSASKSFVEKFSTSINEEYKSQGVTCQCQAPFYVATKLAKMRKSFTVPTPKEYVDAAIKWVGYSDGIVSPIWIHATLGWFFLMIPQTWTIAVFSGSMKGLRKRGLAKDANGGVSPTKKKK